MSSTTPRSLLLPKHAAWPTLLAVTALTTLGCESKTRIRVFTEQLGAFEKVDLSLDLPTKGIARFTGEPAFEKLGPVEVPVSGLKLEVPLAHVSIGQHTVTVTFEGEGQGLSSAMKGTETFTFDRKAITPDLKLKAVAAKGATQLDCKGDVCSLGTVLEVTDDAKLTVDLTDCDGCTVSLTGQQFTVGAAPARATFDLMEAVGEAPIDQLGVNDLQLKFKVKGPDGATSELKAELLGGVLGAIALRRVRQGPVAFGGELADAPARGAAYVRTEPRYGVERVVGAAQRVGDLGLVGLTTATQKTLGSCGVYVNSADGSKSVVLRVGLTYEVTMYDRRSGKVLGHHSFPPVVRGSCGDKLDARTNAITSYPSDEALDDWAKTFFR